jgi:ABC-2 type transport system permease protein
MSTPSNGRSGIDVHLTNAAGIGLVARRELVVRLRSKAYRITTIALVVVIVGFAIVMKLVSGHTSSSAVGLTPQTAPLAQAVAASAKAVGQNVTPSTVPDQATGEAEVRAGHLDALLTGDPAHLTVVVQKNIDSNLETALNLLAQQTVLAEQIHGLGGNPQQVMTSAAHATVAVRPLEKPYPYQTQQLILGIIAGILIYMSLMMNGQAVAQGVVEEKSSRVVELLLATLRPWQLMAGKVLGIGAVGLIQMLVIGVVGVVAGLATHVLTISVSAAASTVAWLVVWYLLGFFMYAIVFAALGALVSRQEDVPGATAPALMFVVLGYVLGISILPHDPGNTLISILSVIPLFAPTMMPMRLVMGGVPLWQAGLSVALVLVLIPMLIWLSARIYRNAVLRTGAKVKLSQALRPA